MQLPGTRSPEALEQLASKRMGYREVLKGVLEGVNILQRQAQAPSLSLIDEHL